MREKQILQYVVAYIRQHGYPPTIQEICEGVGLRSKATVHEYVQRMIADGTLETDAEWGCSRAIRVPGYKFVKDDKTDLNEPERKLQRKVR